MAIHKFRYLLLYWNFNEMAGDYNMNEKPGIIYDDAKKCVDEVIKYVGKEITFCMPLALGKPILFINELYWRAKEDPGIKLKIITALALEKPKGHTDLEKRFLVPLSDRVFEGVLELSLIHISEPTRLGMISYAV